MAKKTIPKASKKVFKSEAQKRERRKAKPKKRKTKVKRRRPQFSKRRIHCLAPRCKRISKGPRFHYLCEKHREAGVRKIRAWTSTKVVSRLKGSVRNAA